MNLELYKHLTQTKVSDTTPVQAAKLTVIQTMLADTISSYRMHNHQVKHRCADNQSEFNLWQTPEKVL